MLVNKVTGNARIVVALATKSGNGFQEGVYYTFTHSRSGSYRTTLPPRKPGSFELERFESFGENSPHLWEGRGNYEAVAGRFVVVSCSVDRCLG